MSRVDLLKVFLLLAIAGSSVAETVVDDVALSDDSTGTNWLAYGRTYSEQRYSPLAEINDKNVQNLGVAWYRDLPDDRFVARCLDFLRVFFVQSSIERVSTNQWRIEVKEFCPGFVIFAILDADKQAGAGAIHD